jgi:hypothetical protein
MLYAQIALALILYGTGYLSAWKVDSLKITKLEVQIESANNIANTKLAEVQRYVDDANKNSEITAKALDESRTKADELVRSNTSTLNSIRMRDPNSHRTCTNTMPKDNNTRNLKTTTNDNTELSTELTELLRTESRRADEITIYANECKTFLETLK